MPGRFVVFYTWSSGRVFLLLLIDKSQGAASLALQVLILFGACISTWMQALSI
jgi:hypothetical protein